MDYKNKNYNSRPVAIVIAKLLIYHNPCLKQVDSRNILFSFLFEEGNVPFKRLPKTNKNQQQKPSSEKKWSLNSSAENHLQKFSWASGLRNSLRLRSLRTSSHCSDETPRAEARPPTPVQHVGIFGAWSRMVRGKKQG